jgi:ectoine hydroxylase-related dioxygenase (phytanoyl-CoA dioxygenase family)
MYTSTNGVKEGTIANFTMLVGVYLSDVLTDFAGNLSVWPGSHHIFEKHFRENGPQSLFNGMPKVELPPGHQVKARAGDAVLCHYQLGHGVTPNVSPYVRYGIFFRLKHREHDANSMEVMTDIWKHWPGVHELLERDREANLVGA